MAVDPYSDPDFIMSLYQDPSNEVLLAEYLLSTGAVQLGISPASGPGGATAGGVVTVTEIGGGGGGPGEGPCFIGITPIMMADNTEIPIREIRPLQFNLGFDADGKLAPSQIQKVFIHGATSCLLALFDDGRETAVTAIHPYWQDKDVFTRIDQIKHSRALVGEKWRRSKLISLEVFDPKHPFLVWNFETQMGTYIANRDGVHNTKPIGGIEN